MTDKQFDIYLLGDIQPGLVRGQVVANLAQVFKREPEAVEAMLAKPRSLIKRGVDEAIARKYQKVINDAGGLCELEAISVELALVDDPESSVSVQEPDHSVASTTSPYAPPISATAAGNAGSFFCSSCGAPLHKGVSRCVKCGMAQQQFSAKDKTLAGVLAFFVGGLGVHRFYLGQWWGIFYLLFWGTLIPSIVSVIEAIVFWATSRESWDRKYGQVPRNNTVLVAILATLGFVFLIGILAAIALPAYQDYTRRTQVSQAMPVISEARQQVESFALREGRYPQGAEELTLASPADGSKLIRLELQGEGQVVATYEFTGAESTIIWVPSRRDDSFDWSCTGGTLANKYRPPQCRDAQQTAAAASGLKRIYSPDRKLSLEVPGSWQENHTLSEDASLGAFNGRQEVYVLVIEDPFVDFEEVLALEEYAELILGNMNSNIDNARYASDLNTVVIDGWPAYQRVLQGSVDNIKITYLITLVEREHSFYQVISWTLSSRFKDRYDDFKSIARSFREH